MREPKVGDWVCYLDGEGTCLGIIEYVTDKGISGIHFGFGLTLADAMADTVMKIWAMMNPTKETR